MKSTVNNPVNEVTEQETDKTKITIGLWWVYEREVEKMALNQEVQAVKAVRREERSKRGWGGANVQLQTSKEDTCQ